jgi:hypothetical protein
MNMFIKTPEDGFHFSSDGIAIIEKQYGAKYMGYWTILRKSGWSDTPVDVFYQPNADASKGHSNYFGMFRPYKGQVMITDAASAFSEPITGLLTDDGEVIVSRYRHDCVVKGSYMIDGGRDYLRTSGNADSALVKITVVNGEFVFEEYKSQSQDQPIGEALREVLTIDAKNQNVGLFVEPPNKKLEVVSNQEQPK